MYQSNNAEFSMDLFQNPTNEYRGTPFWSWNGKLEQGRLESQIDTIAEMGFGGYHIHSRIGLETEYLGEEFMRLVKHCERYGAERNMLTWLYDEDKWPSGAGGGRVANDKRFASRYLLFSPNRYSDGYLDRKLKQTSRLTKNGNITLLYRYQVELKNGKLVSYRRLKEDEICRNTWYAYLVVTEPLSWFNNQPYVDTLNPKAIEKFLEVTHEPYYMALGSCFGTTVPAIFTDEPSFHRQEVLDDSNVPQDVGIAYTDGMEAYFQNRYGYSLTNNLPEVFWERADGIYSKVRYDYYDCVAWMFADAYGKTLGDWCNSHNILLTGHLLFEETLGSQSSVVGEVMRTLRHFSLPGVDMIADRHEYTTVKQAQSISRQYKCPGVASELYGVTNWDFDFRHHKHQGDWQAALGVTTRIPHLVWMSMGGESKRDYPSPLDQHTTWYHKYHIIEDYFSRLNTVLSRGKAHCRIGVIHPIESYWMLMGPNNNTSFQKQELEGVFDDITNWLLFNLLDFDFISEALLPELKQESRDSKLRLGDMSYEVVIVPGMITMRQTTLSALKEFTSNGGKVIFMGTIPSYVDGVPAKEVQLFAHSCTCVGHEKYALLQALEPYRDVEILLPSHLRSERLLYQMRRDGNDRWLFVAQGKHDDRLDLNHWLSQTGRENFTIMIRGIYSADRLDAQTGRVFPQEVTHCNGWTCLKIGMYAQDSLLLWLKPTTTLCLEQVRISERKVLAERYLPTITEYQMDEPNILVLDQAEYCLDQSEWKQKEEVLRIDDEIRRCCGYQLRTASFPQPWLEPNQPIEHDVILRFTVDSEIELPMVVLAYEHQEGAMVYWNGVEICNPATRRYLDEDIHCRPLGKLKKGNNTLELHIPFGQGTNIEACYLRGDFGVRVIGDHSTIIAKPSMLAFGDVVNQGFPFYGGNITYRCQVHGDGNDLEIEIPEYYGVLLEVELDGKRKDVYAEPHCVVFDKVSPGVHDLQIHLYGSRINTFGQLHNCNRKERYFGPKTWRSIGKNWSYTYQLRPVGIMVPPIVRTTKSET